eukprot:4577054-Pyramimonas_sp.AAC.1
MVRVVGPTGEARRRQSNSHLVMIEALVRSLHFRYVCPTRFFVAESAEGASATAERRAHTPGGGARAGGAPRLAWRR